LLGPAAVTNRTTMLFRFSLTSLSIAVLGCWSSAPPPGNGATSSSTVSTTTGGGGAGEGGAASCPSCDSPGSVGKLANPAIDETSGLVASALHPGSYYLHNDSGDSARFFAIGPAGEDRGLYELEGVTAVDWEDVARGPCSGEGSCLYFADFGDNASQRSEYVIHRVAEPALLEPGTRAVPFESFRYVYPDGSRNAEALLVHPTTGAPIILTKDAGRTQLYELSLPLDGGRVATARLLGQATLPDLLPLATGADFAPDGSAILVRTYTSLWFYGVAPGEGVAEALARMPCSLPVAGEQQGEAVAWALDGKSYVTVSEGVGAAINVAACR
jgi:hypothetical protein